MEQQQKTFCGCGEEVEAILIRLARAYEEEPRCYSCRKEEEEEDY